MTLEGTSFDGYRLLRLLGSGGAGEVYLALSPVDGPRADQVAIKIFRDARRDPVALNLMRETQAVAALQHPHILPCYGDAMQGDDLGIVMEYALDGSLGHVLMAGDSSLTLPLRPDVTARIVSQVARTLAEIHGRGLAHGDLKPNNLFVRNSSSGGPAVSLSDFGHAFLAHAAVATIRRDRSGTPPEWATMQLAWAAPEQLDGEATPASDQYSLAAIAYYLLTGIWPVSAEAQMILNSRAPRPITPASQLNPALDGAVDAALFQALSPLRGQRFGGVLAFATALENTLGAANRRAIAAPKVAPVMPPAAPDTARRPGRRGGARRAGRANNLDDQPTRRTLAQMSYPALPATPTGVRRRPIVVNDEELPDSSSDGIASTNTRRRITNVALLALVLALLASGFGAFALKARSSQNDLSRNNGARSTVLAQSSSTPQSLAEQQAESRLQAALAKRPAYSDALTGTPAAWAVNGKSVYFGTDQSLHLLNTAKTPLFADMPASALIPKGAYVASVDVSLLKGTTSDHAGLRFLISESSQGDTYYSYLVTPDGRFEIWRQQPGTGLVFLTSGYAASLKAGMGQVNTLAVLVDPTAGMLTLFANGAFIYQAPIGSGIAVTGRLGVLTPDTGVEATFTHFAIYSA